MALMNKQRAMTLGEGALSYVKSKIKLGASNDLSNPNVWKNPEGNYSVFDKSVVSICVDDLRANSRSMLRDPDVSKLDKHLDYADRIEKTGCGNCGEQSALAFTWLMRHRAVPVEIMRISNGDHVFCVLNRDLRTDPANPDQWNEASVYCDPWRNLLSHGREMSRVNRKSGFGFGSVKYHFEVVVRQER